jgi:uncharacterized protein YggE
MLYHAMTESVAAEHAARMTAMDSATNNASDMIDALTLHMNRVRQAAITKEIIEIPAARAAVCAARKGHLREGSDFAERRQKKWQRTSAR